MNQTTKWVVIIVVAVSVVGGYFLLTSNRQLSGESVKIGFINPLTGDASSIGTVAKAAVEIAVEEVNRTGGINGRPLEVIYEDGQCNAKTANNAANKLINIDKVPVIIGGLCSTETSAFGPMAMQNKVVVISNCSSAPSLSNLGKYFFRSYPSDAFQGKFGAEYAYNTLGARKVAVVYHISEWGTGIKDVFGKRFVELGGQIVSEDGAPQEAKDYRTTMSKVKNLDIDLIYAPMYPDGSIIALKQAQELGIKTKFLGADAWSDPKMQKEVSGKGDFLFTAPVNNLPDDFNKKVMAKTGGDQVPICVSNAYDNVKIVAEVMKRFGTDPDKMQEAIRQMKYDGVSGHIEFDSNGDVTSASYVVNKIEGGGAMEVK